MAAALFDDILRRANDKDDISLSTEEVEFLASDAGLLQLAQLMEKTLTSPAASLAPCRMVRALAVELGSSTIHKIMDSSAIVPALVHTLQMHSSDVAIQRHICASLLPFLCTGQGQQRFIAEGGVPEVLQVMHLHPEHCDLQSQCCRVLLELSNSSMAIKTLLSENIIDVLVATMRWHQSSPGLLVHHVQLLRQLIDNDDLKNNAGDQGAIECLLNCLQSSTVGHPIRERCIWTLFDLCYDDDGNVKRFLSSRGPEIILYCLSTSTESAEHVACLKLLSSLGSDNDALQPSLIRDDGLAKVLCGMEAMLQDAGLQLEYTGLLASLTIKEDSLEQVGSLSIPLLCRCMQYHPNDVAILTRIMFTLANLTQCADNQKRLRDCEGIPLLLGCLQHHVDCLELQLQCCKVIHNLAARDEDLRQDIILEGGVKDICDVMQAHPTNTTLQYQYCSVLVNLGEDVDVQRLI